MEQSKIRLEKLNKALCRLEETLKNLADEIAEKVKEYFSLMKSVSSRLKLS